MIVKDDVIHDNPEEILTNLNSANPKSTKGHGGSSIMVVRKELEEIGGKLEYQDKDGKIIAVATWDEI